MSSRAIETSRKLTMRNPMFYYQLIRLANLDLLYFLGEAITKPFEEVALLDSTNKRSLNEITQEITKLVR